MPSLSPRLRTTAISTLILLSFTLLAAPYLTRSLQIDEATSIWFTRLPWSTFLQDFCDPHPPTYYLLLKGWLTLGSQAFWARTFSLWAVLLAIAFTIRLGKDWLNAHTGLLAAALFAFQPLTIWYAVQARMYPLVMLLGILTTWLAWHSWQDDNKKYRTWFWYWLSASTLIWVDFTGFLVWGTLQCIWLAFNRPHLRGWLITQTAVLLPFFILFPLLPARQMLSQGYQPVFIAIQAANLGLALSPDQATTVMFGLLAGSGTLALIISAYSPKLYHRWPNQVHILLTILLISAWLILLLATAIPRLFTIKRLLVPLLPILALATAGVTIKWPVRRAAALILPGLFICLFVLPSHTSDEWKTAIDTITKNAPQGAVFWVDDMVVPAFAYYADPELINQWTVLNGRALPELPDAIPEGSAPLYLVTDHSPYRDLFILLPPTFHQRFQMKQDMSWAGVTIYEFQKTASNDENIGSHPTPTPSIKDEWGLRLPSPLANCQQP